MALVLRGGASDRVPILPHPSKEFILRSESESESNFTVKISLRPADGIALNAENDGVS